ncbi:MAG TPA: protein TolQ [Methylophaga aminisulfidivorans]|uniref:Protein TolQ n=1 Tax=Methylophaga aminisulfidivorans TaxID=230105 RepID=A0A7C1W0G3_9GAMM|nr:protein TolQ [Methylophaga aminisulfidivorans]
METTVHEMSILGLVSDASLLVKLVMVILVLSSLLSWYLIIWRSQVLKKREKDIQSFYSQFKQTTDIHSLALMGANAGSSSSALAAILQTGVSEQHAFSQSSSLSHDAIMGNIERAIMVDINEQESELETGLSTLATIGSVSPYIGLFGTVWGIMNSFIGLSQVEQATLNTVAPGIAEALIATAIGLFAAIPAVIAYNRLSMRATDISTRYYQFGNELMTRLQRLSIRASQQKAA